jgi:hypothetical protein
MQPSPWKPNHFLRWLAGVSLVLGFIGLWASLRAPETRVAPAKLEQVLGLKLPSSATDVHLSIGGFIDTQIQAKFEMSKRDVTGFLTKNRLELDGSLRSIQEAESGLTWWQPQRLLQAKTYGLIGGGKPLRQSRTTTGYFLNVLIGEAHGQDKLLTVYVRASDD